MRGILHIGHGTPIGNAQVHWLILLFKHILDLQQLQCHRERLKFN